MKSKLLFEDINRHNPEIMEERTRAVENLKEEGKIKDKILSKSEITVKEAFQPLIDERNELNNIYCELIKKEISKDLVKESKALRLKLVKVRKGIEKVHKSQKDFFLQGGRFVDSWKKKETLPVSLMEEKLSEIENYYDNLEKERIAKIQKERITLVSPYMDTENLVLSDMEEDVFQAYLSTKKTNFETQKKMDEELEAIRIKEIEDERKEQERIKLENEKLKREAKEKAEQEAKEKAKQEAEKERLLNIQKAKDEEIRIQKEKVERLERKVEEERLKLIQDEKDKLAREKAKQEAEKQLELSKNDEQKRSDLIKELNSIKSKYVFTSKVNIKIFQGVCVLIDKIIKYID